MAQIQDAADTGTIDRLAVLKTRLTRDYKLEVPFVNAGMAFVATAPLASAVCKAGGLGMIGIAAMDPAFLRSQIGEIRRATNRTFGVDIIARFSAPEQIALTCQRVRYCGGSAPSPPPRNALPVGRLTPRRVFSVPSNQSLQSPHAIRTSHADGRRFSPPRAHTRLSRTDAHQGGLPRTAATSEARKAYVVVIYSRRTAQWRMSCMSHRLGRL
jgi:NAD(P)H-dependent flavin oxidoreductase YrpB (nitropropane dioxygenase family)